MKTRALAFALAAIAAGCSTPPQSTPGTEGSSPDKLAVVSVAGDEVKILEADGKPMPGSGTSDFYLQPGTHRLTVGLHWCPGGLCTSVGSFAETPRSACFNAKAGMVYRLSAGNLGPDWVPRITEKASGGEAKLIDSRCA